MKKIILKSVLGSLLLNGICMLINLISYYTAGMIPLGISVNGGEMRGKLGFGIYIEKIYPESNTEIGRQVRESINFEPISIAISFLVIFLLLFAVLRIVNKRKLT